MSQLKQMIPIALTIENHSKEFKLHSYLKALKLKNYGFACQTNWLKIKLIFNDLKKIDLTLLKKHFQLFKAKTITGNCKVGWSV